MDDIANLYEVQDATQSALQFQSTMMTFLLYAVGLLLLLYILYAIAIYRETNIFILVLIFGTALSLVLIKFINAAII